MVSTEPSSNRCRISHRDVSHITRVLHGVSMVMFHWYSLLYH
jgi:hypothetical protein